MPRPFEKKRREGERRGALTARRREHFLQAAHLRSRGPTVEEVLPLEAGESHSWAPDYTFFTAKVTAY